jgi:hypothetical protein
MRFMLVIVYLMATAGYGLAQQGSVGLPNGPHGIVGGTTGPHGTEFNIQASKGNDILRHRDFTGKPCLIVGAFARPHTINPQLYDHVITATNGCPQRIVMRVCYYQSEDCIQMEVPGSQRREAILGTLPSAKDFRYEFQEKF